VDGGGDLSEWVHHAGGGLGVDDAHDVEPLATERVPHRAGVQRPVELDRQPLHRRATGRQPVADHLAVRTADQVERPYSRAAEAPRGRLEQQDRLTLQQ
jgi:hypothetical protein